MKAESLLSVCMIVKNEERLLPQAIASVQAVADEIVILDTGSTDQTVELARGASKVWTFSYPIDQIQSFADLRNLAFSKAASKYVMWLDAGDRVGDAAELRREVKKETTDVIAMNTIYGQRVFLRERVVPRASARFVDRVHETMDIGGLTCRAIDVPIYHEKVKNVGRESSLPRNVRLLKMMLEESPEEHPRRSRWEYYLACDLLTMGKEDDALEHFRIRADMDVFTEERALAAINVAEILYHRGMHQKAIEAAKKTIEIKDSWRDPYLFIGQCYYALADYNEAIKWFGFCLTIDRPQGILPSSTALYGGFPLVCLAKCCERMEDFEEAERWVKKALQYTPPVQVPEMVVWIEALQAAQSQKKGKDL